MLYVFDLESCRCQTGYHELVCYNVLYYFRLRCVYCVGNHHVCSCVAGKKTTRNITKIIALQQNMYVIETLKLLETYQYTTVRVGA